MATLTQAVTSCDNCPLRWDDDCEGFFASACWHPDLKDVDHTSRRTPDKGPPPEWCPLRGADIMIGLVKVGP